MQRDVAFLGRVTHDLRGELATMVAGVHYLMRYEAGVGPSGKQMLDRVNGAGQRLRRLLDELELAAWIGGTPEGATPAIEQSRLDVLVDAAIGRLQGVITQRNVTAEVAVNGELPEIEIDPELSGAAIELAIDFAVARSPGKTVHVTSAIEAGFAVVRIADEGGLPDDSALARIFEPFAEKDLVARPEPGARRRERLGLGLAIARGVLRAQGGSVVTEPSPRGITLALRFRARG